MSMSVRVLLAVVLAAGTLGGGACTSSSDPSAVSAGTLHVHDSLSSEYVTDRPVSVWLPPGYDTTAAKGYPVLYMHDGQNLFHADSSHGETEWQVDETLSRLIEAGTVPPVIVVGIHSTDRRTREYLPRTPFYLQPDSVWRQMRRRMGPPQSDAYLQFLVWELRPFLNRRYHTRLDASDTYVAGAGMGGLLSIYAAAKYPSMFGGAASLSTHWNPGRTGRDTTFAAAFRDYMDGQMAGLRSVRLYFDHGTGTPDSLYVPQQALIDSFLVVRDFPVEQWTSRRIRGAKHHEEAWAARWDRVATFLLAPSSTD